MMVVLVWFAKDSARQAVRNIVNHRAYEAGPYSKSARDVFSFIEMQTADEDVIVFWKPRVLRLFTGRQSIMINDPSQLRRGDCICYIAEQDTHNQVALTDLERLVEQGHLKQVYSNDGFVVYQIVESDDHRESSSANREQYGTVGSFPIS